MVKNVYGSGTMEIELNGKTYELVASPKAMKNINRAFGGLGVAFQSIQNMDVEAIETILRAGLTRRSDAEDLENDIFAAGLAKAVKPAVEFLVMVQNGGRTAEEVEQEAAEEEEKRPLAKKVPKSEAA